MKNLPKPSPPVGQVSLGHLRRVSPISSYWGVDRGKAVDRRYIEDFLQANAGDIRGRVMEVKDAGYTHMFGGDRVIHTEIVDIDSSNKLATVLADLEDAPELKDDAYDCVVLTQVLPVLFNPPAAIATVHRILRPGGILLMTAPGPFSPSFKGDAYENFYWAFYPGTVTRMLAAHFHRDQFQVQARGNLTTCVAFIAGLAQEDLSDDDFDPHDEAYPLIITARAVKSGQ